MRKLKEVTIEINQRCKSNCLFCSSFSGISKIHEIPYDKVCEVMQFCKEKGATTINLSGGEPLLNRRICEIISYANSIDLKLTVYTSGNVKDYKIFDTLSETYIPKSNLKFIFNYPSYQDDIFRYLINDDTTTIDNIDGAIKKLITKSIVVEAHIVPNALNIETLFETAQHLKKIGVSKVSLLRMVFQGRAETNKDLLELKENKTLIKIINDIKHNVCDDTFNLRTGIPFSDLTKEKCECFAGYSKLIFRYDGVVFPCEAFKEAPNNEDFQLGNIYHNNLEKIWTNHPVHERLNILKLRAVKSAEACPAQLLYS